MASKDVNALSAGPVQALKPHLSRSPSGRTYLGNYVVGKTLGEGSFGRVVLGTHILTEETVAIKVMEKSKIKDSVDMERTQREIGILKLLDHPNIVRLYEVIDTPTEIYLILEHASGGELFDYIVARGRVKEKEARQFFREIVSSVHYCHQHQIIHRDLKPENLLLEDNRIKIIDFGFSQFHTPGKLMNTFCGSPAYAPPEMIAGQAYTGTEVDVWSMGVILYALLCGYLPFDDDNVSQLYAKVMKGDYRLPSFLSRAAGDLISRMLVIEPKGRVSLQDIASHEWVNDGCEEPLALPDYNERVLHIEDDLLDQLRDIGFSSKEIENAVSSLEKGEQNTLTATYHLLMAKRRREGAAGLTRRTSSREELPLSPMSAGGKSPKVPNTKPRVSSPLAVPGSPLSTSTAALEREKSPTPKSDRPDMLSQSMGTMSPPTFMTARVEAATGRRASAAGLTLNTKAVAAASASLTAPAKVRKPSLLAPLIDEKAMRRRSIGGMGGDVTESDIAKLDADLEGRKNAAATEDREISITLPPIMPPKTIEGDTKGKLVEEFRARGRTHSLSVEGADVINKFRANKEKAAEGKLRTVKGIFSVSTTSNKGPDEMLAEVERALGDAAVVYERNAYRLECTTGGDPESKEHVKFELEICKIPKMTMLGLRLKRVHGDTWTYKRICHQLVSQMSL